MNKLIDNIGYEEFIPISNNHEAIVDKLLEFEGHIHREEPREALKYLVRHPELYRIFQRKISVFMGFHQDILKLLEEKEK